MWDSPSTRLLMRRMNVDGSAERTVRAGHVVDQVSALYHTRVVLDEKTLLVHHIVALRRRTL